MMELRSLILLLIAVLLAQHSRACAPNCASVTSNRVVNKTIDRVVVSGVEEAQWRGICHSFCINAVNTSTRNTTSLPSWPAVLEVDTGCGKISNYLRCVEGCVSRRFQNTTQTNKQCQDDCSNRCDATCFGLDCDSEVGSNCKLRCKGGGCKTGCSDSMDLMVSNDQSPAAPIGSDITILTTSSGSFLLDVRNTQPSSTSSLLHSFVVRIDSDDITKYWWMGNFEETELDLSEFMCKEVNISFAVINQHGISDFSPRQTFCLKDARPPSAVNVTFKEIAKDSGHPGLFTVNVTWTHTSDVALEEVQYRVSIIGSCGKTVEITSNTTSISEPGFAPRCRLTVRVNTVLINNSIESIPTTITGVTLQYTDLTTVVVNHTLEPDVYTGIYNLTIYISLLTHDPLLLASILGIQVNHFKPVGIRPEDFVEEEISTSENMSDYSISFQFDPMDSSEVTVRYVVLVQQASFQLGYRGRFTHFGGRNIVYRGRPPSTVNSIDIVNGTVDVVTSTILLNITWEPPYSYGELQYYELRLTGEVNGTESHVFGGKRVYSVNEAFNATISLEVETYLLELFSRNKIGASQSTFLNFSLSEYYDNTTNIPVVTDQPVMSQHSEEDTTTPVYAYYIIGIGSAVLLIALTLAVCCCTYTCYVRWNNAKELPPLTSVKDPWGLYSEKGFFREPSIIISDGPPIVSDAWEVNPDHILLGKELGSGFFGEVYRCTVQGPITTPYTERNQLSRSLALPAAVKILKENATEKMHSDFTKEIELMKRVGEKNNSHVVSMICCSTIKAPNALVLEYVEYGDLLQYLQKNKVFVLKNKMKEEPIDSNEALPYLEPGDQYSHLAPRNMSSPYDHLRNVMSDTKSVAEDPYPDLRQLLPVDMVTFAYQIADGMEYLSSLGIIHRDLACRNVLVGTNKILKISDFGLARQLSDNLVYYRSTEGKLPIRWMAPEAIKDRIFNTYTDIWSYGVTLWEICTLGAFPYSLLSNRDVLHAIFNGQRLEQPPNCTEDMYEIMLDCWKADPESRPSFSLLKHKTEEIIQQANQAYPYLDFNLQDYLPYCNLRLTSEAVSTENILDEYKQSEDNEKENSGSEFGEETKKGKERENMSSPTEV